MLLLQSQLYADNNINAVHSELECFFQILCRFYVGRKAMFDSDFKGGILAELSITFVNF